MAEPNGAPPTTAYPSQLPRQRPTPPYTSTPPLSHGPSHAASTLRPPSFSTSPPSSSSPPAPSSFWSNHASIFQLFSANQNAAKYNVPQVASRHAHETVLSIFFDVTRRLIPSLCHPRPIRRAFARTLDNALRAAVSFVVAAVIAAQSWAINLLAVPYLLVIFAAITIRPTVGSTIQTIDAQGKGVLAAVVLDVVLIAVGLGDISPTRRIIACEIILLVTCAILAYYFHPPLARRFSLAMHALILVGIAGGEDDVVYPLKIGLNMLLSYSISFILVLLPFPRLARDELLDRWQQSALCLSTLLHHTIEAWLAVEPITPMVLHTSATSQLESVFVSLTNMRRLQTEAALEASLITFFFPASISGAPVVEPDPDRIEQLYWIVRNLLQSLNSLRYTSNHGPFIYYLRDAFREFSSAQREYVQLLCSEQPAVVTQERLDAAKQRLDAAIEQAWVSFSEARTRVYVAKGPMEDIEQAQREQLLYRADPYIPKKQPEQQQQQAGEPMTFLRRDSDVLRDTRPPHSHHAPTLSASTHDVFLRSSFVFYLARFHVALCKVKLRADILAPLSPPLSSSSPTTTPSSPSAIQSARRRRFLHTQLTAALHEPWSWSILGMHPVRDFFAMLRDGWALVRQPAVDVKWLKSSLKIALIICVASLIAVIPQVETSSALPNSVWACFTAAILTSDTEGALWQRAAHRMFGTLFGGLIGYLILLAFPDNWYGSIPLLAVWVVAMQFVQASSYNYLGALSAFTAIVVVFGHRLTASGASLTAERYTLAREEEIVIGVVIALMISSVLWPVSSIRLIRSEVMLSLGSFQVGLDNTLSVYESLGKKYVRWKESKDRSPEMERVGEIEEKQTQPQQLQQLVLDVAKNEGEQKVNGAGAVNAKAETHHISAVEEEDELLNALLSASSSVQMSLSRQVRLLGEVNSEPATFFSRFPYTAYDELMRTQRRIWSLILTLEPALRDILVTQAAAAAEVEAQLFDIPVLRLHVQTLMHHIQHVLRACVDALECGQAPESEEMRAVVDAVHSMESGFALEMNDMAKRVREGRMKMMASVAIVPITVFLYAAVQLAEQVLVLQAAIHRLLQLEQPHSYDD